MIPRGWPLVEIRRFPNDGNNRMAMFLTRVNQARPGPASEED